mmetsp:Transcript_95796/g.175480  ORF Transcript_95796/g.175480 Transcript_95796/m.175480 type:complete len:207 (-) Transcript_95796:424-1044(-)
MFAMPDYLVGRCFVQTQTERGLVLPHLSSDIIAPTQLIGKTFSLLVENDASDTTECLCCQEFDLCIGVIGLHKTSGVHLNPFQINGLATNGLSHLDAISSAVFAVGGRQVHEVWTVLRKQRVACEICTEATTGKDDRAMLLKLQATLLIHKSNTGTVSVGEQLGCAGLSDYTRHVCLLGHLFDHLDQRICNCHAREALLATVRARG